MAKVSGREIAGFVVALVVVGILLSWSGLMFPIIICAGFAILIAFLLTVAKVDYEGEEKSLRKEDTDPDDDEE